MPGHHHFQVKQSQSLLMDVNVDVLLLLPLCPLFPFYTVTRADVTRAIPTSIHLLAYFHQLKKKLAENEIE